MSRTRKPCPGCGEVHPGRPADSVCGTCSRKLSSWEQYSASLTTTENSEMEFVKLSEVEYAWPGFYNGACSHHEIKNFEERRDGLSGCMHRLAYRLAQTIFPDGTEPRESWGSSNVLFKRPSFDYPLGDHMPAWFRTTALYKKSDVDLFRALYDHIAQFSEMCYLAGLSGGQNILQGLVTGTLDLNELSQTNIRLAEAAQKAGKRKAYKRDLGTNRTPRGCK